jgi:predicted MPP superfamily phosphohydrolase
MIRIVHVSDLHINISSIKDIEEFIIRSLLNDLDKYNAQKKIDLIIVSGDLVDRGGESFDNKVVNGLDKYEEIFTKPIIDRLKIPKENIFHCPGNHDIERKADDVILETGLRNTLITSESVNSFIDSGKELGISRIKGYKDFEKKYYKDFLGPKQITNYQSAFEVLLGDIKVGVTCFNSAWRAYDNEDQGKLIIGERQITNARAINEKSSLKIGVIHHPLDWLAPFDQENIEKFLFKDYNLLFCGHVHKGSVWTKSGMYGNLFVSMAPANWYYNIRSTDRINANGYSIIDYDIENMQVINHSRRYIHGKGYDPNTDLGDEQGKLTFQIPRWLY